VIFKITIINYKLLSQKPSVDEKFVTLPIQEERTILTLQYPYLKIGTIKQICGNEEIYFRNLMRKVKPESTS
jgi:hypothetical protein